MPLDNTAPEDLDARFKRLVAKTRDPVHEVQKEVSKFTQSHATAPSVNSTAVLKSFIKNSTEGARNSNKNLVSSTPAKVKVETSGSTTKSAGFKATPFNKKIFAQVTGVPFVKLRKPTVPRSPKFASSKSSTEQQKDKQQKVTESKPVKPRMRKESSFGASNIPFVPVKKTVTVKPFKFHSVSKDKKEVNERKQITETSKIVAKPAAPMNSLKTVGAASAPKAAVKTAVKATPVQAARGTAKPTAKTTIPGTQKKALPTASSKKLKSSAASTATTTKAAASCGNKELTTTTASVANPKIAPTPMKPKQEEHTVTPTKRKFGSCTPLHRKLVLKPDAKAVPSSCAKINPRLHASNASISTSKDKALRLFRTPMKLQDCPTKTTKPKLKRLPITFNDFAARMKQKEEEKQEKLRQEREKQEEELKEMRKNMNFKATKRLRDSIVKIVPSAKKVTKPKPFNFDK